MRNIMKIATFLFLILLYPLMSFAQVEMRYYSQMPRQDAGYMIHETIDYDGRKVFIKTPISSGRHISKGGYAHYSEMDEDAGISYRDCRIELSRAKHEIRVGKIFNDPEHYPLYMDE